ncbi:hypothetical protein CW751_03835 [Brumimicrobium salinarum]|uniref:Anaphase-promoting complex subunit 4-like WD40 domain-containing protein n=1 Tax=Brumimicrobium salinarum TaxID=2058658 RepID=A0A2I0R513_9FLAO|nr:WD40 repeat domain-containing protein [Brumimicrobium salinarum]PKR81667.1 hypothetical protein CW751_03835 [Brumimicrobium salinarum]
MDNSDSLQLLKTIEGHSGAIYDIIHAEGFLFSASADRFVAQWNPSTGEQTNFAVQLERASYNVAYAPEDQLLVIGTNNGGIHVVDIKSREEKRLLSQHKFAVFSLTYCPHKEIFYSGDKEGYLCVWKSKTFELLITLPFNCGKIRDISISEKGEFIAICGQDGIIRILETEFFNVIHEFKAHKDGVNCAIFNEEILYTGGKDAHIKKWNWRKEELLLNIPAHNYAVYDLALLNNKEVLISVSFDKSIKVWNANDISIKERVEFKNKGHRHTVNRIAKIDDHKFATVSDDRKIKIWSLIN